MALDIDRHFRRDNINRYILQCGLAGLVVLVLLLVLDTVTQTVLIAALGAVAISLAMFTMVVTRTEHPPAAALALGLVLNEWTLLTLLVALLGVIGLSIVKQLVLPALLDLI